MAPELPPDQLRVLAELMRLGLLDQDGAARAARLSQMSGQSIVRVILDLGLTPEDALIGAISGLLGLGLVEADGFPDALLEGTGLSERFVVAAGVVPLACDAEQLTIAIADPFDAYTLNAVRLAARRTVGLKLARKSAIDAAVARFVARSPVAAEGGDGMTAVELDLVKLRESASEAPVVRRVSSLIAQGVDLGASDIHLEPMERSLRVRFRVDGVLREAQPIPIEAAAAVLSRLKIISGLNIAERRLPQDGAVKTSVLGKQIDLRIATVPSVEGEAASIRILDQNNAAPDFDSLGFDAEFRRSIVQLLASPNGILLVTGPTGSGKTTTLHACLLHLKSVERKIVAIEDPVEYRIPGVTQIQVKPQIGLTFAASLRAVLRHDPDILMIGEIRDVETAKIAVQAALAGRLVLSTLHTNSAAGAIARLLEMGVEDYLLASTLIGVVAQRLARRLCAVCTARAPVAEVGARPGSSCSSCGGAGFRGRCVVQETLIPNDQIRNMILTRRTAPDIHVAAAAAGTKTLWQNGLSAVQAGLTTLREMRRVVQEDGGSLE